MVILLKIYLGPIFQWFKENRFVFPFKVGINASSSEWDLFVRSLIARHSNIVDSDFSNWDKHLSMMILAGEVVCKLYALLGWSDKHIQMVKLLITTYAKGYYNFEGVVFRALMGGSSGKYGTAEMNSVMQLLYEEMALVVALVLHFRITMKMAIQLAKTKYSFFKHITHACYGDDSVKCISDELKEIYTPELMVKAMAELGQVVTDGADKTKPPQYKTLEQVSFLKRSFRYDDDIKEYKAPLAEKSIYKMLVIRDVGDLNDIQHSCVVLEEAQKHFFLHGREKFDNFIIKAKDIISKIPDLHDTKIFDYDELSNLYAESYNKQIPFTCAYTGSFEELSRNRPFDEKECES